MNELYTDEEQRADQVPLDRAELDAFKQEAMRLFNQEIFGRWKNARNVWRTAWALDTLLDYFATCDVTPAPYAQAALDALNPVYQGNWWDDFGWIGIPALRAAEQDISPTHRDDFVKIAINAWAYMHGPGWSLSNEHIYPFTDIPGWKEFEVSHTPNVGAPNAWKDIEQTWPGISPTGKMQLRPRYSPGGAWNATIKSDRHPIPVPNDSGAADYLAPIQNTVTNGLYAILTLRIHQASQNPAFSRVFQASGLDTGRCQKVWKEQIAWLNQWMVQSVDPVESLLFRLDAGSLVRERVSTFHPVGSQMYWDAAYRRNLAWTGDQGLLLGALREGQAAGVLAPAPPVLGLYPELIRGMFTHGYAQRSYGSVTGSFPLPWMVIGASNPFTTEAPGNDPGNYQTGVGVFMRYLLQAYKANPSLVGGYAASITNTARSIVRRGFGENAQPPGQCDAFTPSGDEVNQMTAYINRLSILVLAIEVNR